MDHILKKKWIFLIKNYKNRGGELIPTSFFTFGGYCTYPIKVLGIHACRVAFPTIDAGHWNGAY